MVVEEDHKLEMDGDNDGDNHGCEQGTLTRDSSILRQMFGGEQNKY